MRKTALILVFVMVLSCIPFAVQADDNVFAENKYYETLTAFGILNETAFSGDENTVSREDFVKAAVMLCGVDTELSIGADEVNPFSDVDSYSENYPAIIYAYKLGIISGTSATTFEPSKAIKFSEAVKVALSALGYTQIANAAGGYPSGYLTIAAQKGVLKGVAQSTDSLLTPENFVRIIYNCLEVEVIEISSFKTEGISLKEGSILREGVLGIYKVSGVLESNEYTSLNGTTNVGDNQVYISGKTLNTGDLNAAELIGLRVDGYYKQDENGNNVLLYVAPDEVRNDVIKVSDKDISEGATTKRTFVYYDKFKDKDVELAISVTASLIYNGGQTELTKENIIPSNGEVLLIDNNGDDVIDVLKVMNYTTIVVYGIDSIDYKITGKNQSVIELDPLSDDYDAIITKNEIPMEFNDIDYNNVISYAEPIGTKNIKYAIVSSSKATGKVEELYENNAVISGVEYEVAEEATVTLGMTGTFYLDFKGMIVSHKAEFDAVYGYLNAIYKENGLKSFVVAELFTENGNWVQLTFCDKIDFGGVQTKAVDFYDGIYNTSFRQLVKYRVNEEGKISAIYFAVRTQWLSEEEKTLIDNATFRISNYLESSTYRSNTTSFNGLINLVPSTIVFIIPADPDEKDSFQIVSNTKLVSGRSYTNVYSYDADRTGIPAACVVDDNTSEIVVTSSLAIIDEIRTSLNDNGEVVQSLRCYYSGNTPTTLPIKSDDVLRRAGDLKRGDIIQYSVDSSNSISKITLHYSRSEEDEPFIKGGIYSSFTSILGEVKSVNYQSGRMTVDYGNCATFGIDKLGNLWIYDTERNIAELGTAEDIHEGDVLFARVNYLQAKDVIIFK